MAGLTTVVGPDARDALCDAIDRARSSIHAEFYSIADARVAESLNRAADRGVDVIVTLEGDVNRYRRTHARPPAEPSDAIVRSTLHANVHVIVSRSPRPLVHAKAAVVDGSVALFATANARATGFTAPGEILVVDRDAADVVAVQRKIDAAAAGERTSTPLRASLEGLLSSGADLRIASEDLSDPQVISLLVARARAGRHDRVLVGAHLSKTARKSLHRLVLSGVDVRVPRHGYMHDKYVDDGSTVYVGSANLTFDGLSEANEVGIVAPAARFDDGAAALRTDFDSMWNVAVDIHVDR